MAGVASISVFLGEAGVFAFYKSLLINRKEAISIGKPYNPATPNLSTHNMKKTLATLAAFAMVSVASAAVTDDTTVFYGVASGDEITLNKGTADEETLSVDTRSSETQSELNLTISSSDGSLPGTAGSTSTEQIAYSLTFSLNLDAMATWLKTNTYGECYILQTTSNDNPDYTGNPGTMGLKLNSDGTIETTWNASGRGNTHKTSLFSVSSDRSTATLASNISASLIDGSSADSLGSIVLSYTVGNGTIGTKVYTGDGSTLITDDGLRSSNHMELASVDLNSAFIDDFAITSDALEPVEIKTISKLVPEPATATLSLLALAGLAARRRRK